MLYFCSEIMDKEVFRFKRFEVRHDRSSMRVGTDAVLLGAWADVNVCNATPGSRILDIGSGCGLISLMAAQRCAGSSVLGVDVDEASVDEATENALSGPFADRVKFLRADIRQFACMHDDGKYSLILCNPPYYIEDTLPPEQRRSVARNATHLSFAELVEAVSLLLDEKGVFALVIPMQARDLFVTEALLKNLHIRRECRVRTVSRKTPKRVLLEFDYEGSTNSEPSSIVLQDEIGGRSPEYSSLCSEFYL